MIASKKEADEVLQDEELGELTAVDKVVIEEINKKFRQSVNHSKFNLVAHGPANCFSQSKVSHIHFPAILYFPTGEMKQIEALTPFLSALEKLKGKGYRTPLNPKWNLCENILSLSSL